METGSRSGEMKSVRATQWETTKDSQLEPSSAPKPYWDDQRCIMNSYENDPDLVWVFRYNVLRFSQCRQTSLHLNIKQTHDVYNSSIHIYRLKQRWTGNQGQNWKLEEQKWNCDWKVPIQITGVRLNLNYLCINVTFTGAVQRWLAYWYKIYLV